MVLRSFGTDAQISRNMQKLQEERKKVQNFLEIIGSIYMGILILGLRPEVQIPIWITIVFACVVIPLIVICLMISKRLREI